MYNVQSFLQFICVGDCGVGKSSVLNLYKNMYFNPAECKPTPGLGLVETRVSSLSWTCRDKGKFLGFDL